MRRHDSGLQGRSIPRTLDRIFRAEGGATLAVTASVLGATLGCAAIAVDLGMLTTARVQSQRAADSGALAGAGELSAPDATISEARAEAKEYANKHHVLGMPVDVQDGDVEIDLSERTVRVHVRHTVNTLFARILGIWDTNVSTVATARVAPAGEAECPIPIVAVDRWLDADPDGDGDGLYDDGEPYTSCSQGEPCTGYSEDDVGMVMEIKSQDTSTGESATQTCGAENPEWYCWIDNAPGKGEVSTQELEDLFFNDCAETEFQLAIGDEVESSPGNKMSVVQSVKQYMDDNGGAGLSWNSSQGCVWDGTGCVQSHPLIRSMPIVDPTTIAASGEEAHATVNNFAKVYLEKVAVSFDEPHGSGPPGNWNLYVRMLEGPGGMGGGGQPDALLKSIVLIR